MFPTYRYPRGKDPPPVRYHRQREGDADQGEQDAEQAAPECYRHYVPIAYQEEHK